MLKWAIVFLIISIVAGIFGFTGVARTSKTIAKVLFFICIVIFILLLLFGKLLF